MSCAGLCIHITLALGYDDSKSWPAVAFFLICAIVGSMLRSSYEHYRR